MISKNRFKKLAGLLTEQYNDGGSGRARLYVLEDKVEELAREIDRLKEITPETSGVYKALIHMDAYVNAARKSFAEAEAANREEVEKELAAQREVVRSENHLYSDRDFYQQLVSYGIPDDQLDFDDMIDALYADGHIDPKDSDSYDAAARAVELYISEYEQ